MIFTGDCSPLYQAIKTEGFNPLIQVNDFYDFEKDFKFMAFFSCFNPLIQVNDFYKMYVEDFDYKRCVLIP